MYQVTLARQLEKRGLSVQPEVAVPIEYDGERFEEGFRADLIVEGKVIVELKSVERVGPVPPFYSGISKGQGIPNPRMPPPRPRSIRNLALLPHSMIYWK